MGSPTFTLEARHIQNMSEAKFLEPHWGYAERALPCTNDPGSCKYLDVVYHSHDLGMLYCGILWATIGAILLIWAIGRQAFAPAVRKTMASKTVPQPVSRRGGLARLRNSLAVMSRRNLLPETMRPVFGRTTRLQILVLLALSGYLTIFTFVGIEYNKWVTPVKNMAGVSNTRTSVGPWSDRIGVLAFALTPLSVLLSSRESLLSIMTGIPYQSFNFLHRWLGYIIFVQSALHTITWCIVEMRLYQPQPSVGLEWISQRYMIFGVVAMFFITVMFVLSTPWAIRRTGYEFFRKAHYVMAMLYIGACWGHWSKLNCYLIISLILWVIDRGLRLVRMALLHYNYLPGGSMGFRAAEASITRFLDSENGDVVRLDFVHPSDAWAVGQHFYLCFPAISIWQAHPFTPCSLPIEANNAVKHSYILRAKKGATKALADLADSATRQGPVKDAHNNNEQQRPKTPVILAGPYGRSINEHLTPSTNVLCVAGGTGITFILPVVLQLLQYSQHVDRQIELVWAVRRAADAAWVEEEIASLRTRRERRVRFKVFVTRDHTAGPKVVGSQLVNEKEVDYQEKNKSGSSSNISSCASSGSRDGREDYGPAEAAGANSTTVEPYRPDLDAIVSDFVASAIRGPTTVYASGPGSMISDLRIAVAQCNAPEKVWRGEERYDVRLVCDDRLEW
jgi:predicted ferric reductase